MITGFETCMKYILSYKVRPYKGGLSCKELCGEY
nr:MAG TPA: hypothetical protein [Caudoviricetes sp.]